jgi:hypothetical protein
VRGESREIAVGDKRGGLRIEGGTLKEAAQSGDGSLKQEVTLNTEKTF